MDINKPIKKFRSGNIESAVWLNEKEVNGNKVNFKTVSIRKSWNQDGKWHDQTINLRKNDIQKLLLVLNKAHEDLLLSEEESDEDE